MDVLNDIKLLEVSTPSSPPSGKLSLYAKSDDTLYTKNSSGTEKQVAIKDVNSNLSVNNLLEGYTTTATAAATTTLTVSSTYLQYFTGTTTQTIVLPVASTLVLGQQFCIVNLSTGTITIQSSGANTVQAVSSNYYCIVTCILISGTTAASWSVQYAPLSSTGGGGGGTPGGSNKQVQYNNSSAFAGASQVQIESDGNLELVSTGGTTTISAPSSGNLKLYSLNRTGIDRLVSNPSLGSEQYLQSSISRKNTSVYNTFTETGFGELAYCNIQPSSSSGYQTYSATNLLPNFNTRRISTGTTSGTAAGINCSSGSFTIGTTTYGGGVLVTLVGGFSTYNANQRIFWGVSGSNGFGQFPTGDPSSFFNIVGVGKDVADTTLQIMYNDGSGAATKVNTSITPNQNDVYIVTIFIPSNSTTMYVTLEDHSKTSATIYNSGSLSTNLPVAGSMAPLMMVSNGTTGAARVLDVIQIAQEVDF